MKFTVVNNVLIANGEWPTTVVEAIDVSVDKWKACKLLKPKDEFGPDTCALCQIFSNCANDEFIQCVGCPILEVTGKIGCRGTPYESAEKALEGRLLSFTDQEKDYLINREIRFLRSLRRGWSWLRWSMKQKDGSYQ